MPLAPLGFQTQQGFLTNSRVVWPDFQSSQALRIAMCSHERCLHAMPSAALVCHVSLTQHHMHTETDLDDSGNEDTPQPFSLDAQRQAVIAEPWGITSTPDPSSSPHLTSCPASPSHSPQQPTSSTTQWQAHWLALRIHALRQQQQRYELRLQKLQQQQDSQATVLPSLPTPSSPLSRGFLSWCPSAGSCFRSRCPSAGCWAPSSSPSAVFSTSCSANLAPSLAAPQQAQAQSLATREPEASAGASLVLRGLKWTTCLSPAVREHRYKHRHARQSVPGLSMPEIARHPFFCQHTAAGCGNASEQPAAQGELMYKYCCVMHFMQTIVLLAPVALTGMLKMYFSAETSLALHEFGSSSCCLSACVLHVKSQ